MKSLPFILLLTLSFWSFNLLGNPDSVATKPKTISVKSTEGMTNKKLDVYIKEAAEIQQGTLGLWQITYGRATMFVITDESHNRMRIMMPVVEQKDIKKHQYEEILKAQYDRALDVKYAINDEILWSVFIHPLRELTEKQFKDALSQVYFAAANFGGSYQSTDVVFGGGEEDNADDKKKKY